MRPSTICAALIVIDLLTAQTKLGREGCAGLRSFGIKDSLNTPDLRVERKDLRIQISSKGQDLHLQLEPDTRRSTISSAEFDDEPHRVGWIRVYSCKTGALIQSLEVRSRCGPECFLGFFQVNDVNFDGYLDIAVLRDRGGLWGVQTWWVFSPESGKFISNSFTEALSRVSGNGLELDPAQRKITVPNLWGPGRCSSAKDIYEVEGAQRLVLVHKEDLKPRWNSSHTQAVGCTLTTQDRVNGQMQVTKVEEFSDSPN